MAVQHHKKKQKKNTKKTNKIQGKNENVKASYTTQTIYFDLVKLIAIAFQCHTTKQDKQTQNYHYGHLIREGHYGILATVVLNFKWKNLKTN